MSKNFLPSRKTVTLAFAGLAALFVLANLTVYGIYRGRSYPGTTVGGKYLGSVKIDTLEQKLPQLNLLPDNVQLVFSEKNTEVSISELGIAIDYTKTAANSANRKSWLPLWNFRIKHDLPLQLQVDQTKVQSAVEKVAQAHNKPAEEAQIAQQDGTFFIKDTSTGQSVNVEAAKETVVAELQKGNTNIELPAETADADVAAEKLLPTLQNLQAQQNTLVSLTYQSKSRTFKPQEIGAWFVPNDTGFILSDDKVTEAIEQTGSSFGIKPGNVAQAAAAVKAALQNNKNLELALEPAPRATRTYTYCTAVKGVDSSQLAPFNAKIAEVLADSRGWGLDGQIKYNHAESGCNYTAWLTASSQMTSFGGVCDDYWSCQIGSNVVINFDRWMNATDPWNQAGGNLEDYRVMVINHETGHWLGFGHRYCGGGGQLAPVMQQQSMGLQGCKFNPWPDAAELKILRSSKGL